MHERLVEALEAELAAAMSLRRDLHAHPELGHQEQRTSQRLADELVQLAPEQVAGTGLLVRVGADEGPAVALRAELDGLPIVEETGAPFQATNGLMHACGHDVHMAALVAVCRAVAAVTAGGAAPSAVPLVGVFQPSEETYPSGARQIVEEGGLAAHRVGAVVAVHVHPDPPWATAAVGDGPINASTDELRITVEGAGGHAAYPHLTRDPVLALSHVVVALQHLVSRRADPMRAVVLSIAQLSAGTAPNVLPSTATARGTLRCLNPEDRDELRGLVADTVKHAAAAFGCRGSLEVVEGEPALVNDPALVAAVSARLPPVGLAAGPPLRSCGADDFGYFGGIAPCAMLFLGLGAGSRPSAGLHHSRFFPPDDAVGTAARALLAGYLGAADLVKENR